MPEHHDHNLARSTGSWTGQSPSRTGRNAPSGTGPAGRAGRTPRPTDNRPPRHAGRPRQADRSPHAQVTVELPGTLPELTPEAARTLLRLLRAAHDTGTHSSATRTRTINNGG